MAAHGVRVFGLSRSTLLVLSTRPYTSTLRPPPYNHTTKAHCTEHDAVRQPAPSRSGTSRYVRKLQRLCSRLRDAYTRLGPRTRDSRSPTRRASMLKQRTTPLLSSLSRLVQASLSANKLPTRAALETLHSSADSRPSHRRTVPTNLPSHMC